jgi:hypothetical protein
MEMKGKGGDERKVTGMKTKERLLRWEGGGARGRDMGGDEREGMKGEGMQREGRLLEREGKLLERERGM